VSALARKIGFIFQEPNDQLFAGTAVEDVRFGLKNSAQLADAIEARSAAVLAQLGLEPRDMFPRFLARGDKQKICIAAVVTMNRRYCCLMSRQLAIAGGICCCFVDRPELYR
jgi:energy-coupling factor transporter ATP-binding protein EcfA2